MLSAGCFGHITFTNGHFIKYMLLYSALRRYKINWNIKTAYQKAAAVLHLYIFIQLSLPREAVCRSFTNVCKLGSITTKIISHLSLWSVCKHTRIMTSSSTNRPECLCDCARMQHLLLRTGPLGLRLGVIQRAENSPIGVYPDLPLSFRAAGVMWMTSLLTFQPDKTPSSYLPSANSQKSCLWFTALKSKGQFIMKKKNKQYWSSLVFIFSSKNFELVWCILLW